MAIHNLYIYLWHSFSPYVTFWARCVSQRLAYRGHGHDWQSICVHYICHDLDVHTGTFPHQYQVKLWYFVTKIILNYCEKKKYSDWEKLLKFETEGQEFAKFLRWLEQFFQIVKGQNNFWWQNALLTCSWEKKPDMFSICDFRCFKNNAIWNKINVVESKEVHESVIFGHCALLF